MSLPDTLPLTCAVVTALHALIMLLVAIGNITDFDANEAFVRHVLAMDTTNFGAPAGTDLDPDVMWRAVTSPALQTAAYLAIIAWETLTAAVLLVAMALWLPALRSRAYGRPRRWSSIGLLMMVVLFMGGFIGIGGEWFQMWRSLEWNGIDAAFRYTVFPLLGLILLHLPAAAWAESGEAHPPA